ncbi:MAG: allophanate hydrolase [Verrucomicrobiota bacterium]
MKDLSLDIDSLRRAYQQKCITPREVVEMIHKRMDGQEWRNVWITKLTLEQLEPYFRSLPFSKIDSLPLYGIPFAIKDNIDLVDIPTTAACPEYAYIPTESAYVVQQLIHAGAIPIGKTNLDQFATGLVGTRSPYGSCPNSFNPQYISGGSSSGSAIAVALGWASFSLGTDTAGSGRVPASFNNLVGLKPTRGVLSTKGVVPACRTLDCVSIFALHVGDAKKVFNISSIYNQKDSYSRPFHARKNRSVNQLKIGIPIKKQIFSEEFPETYRLLNENTSLLKNLGYEILQVDISPMLQAAKLLYEGPWLAERYAAIKEFIEKQPESLFPTTREIITCGKKASAVEAFTASYRLQDLIRESEKIWESIDVLLTPTTQTIYTLKEIDSDPIRLNSLLGTFTNFMNLLDFSAITVPAGRYREQLPDLPFGITCVAPSFSDLDLIRFATPFHQAQKCSMGATEHPVPQDVPDDKAPPTHVALAVCGAHLSGLPLNHQLTERQAKLLKCCKTAPSYQFFALEGGPPYRPGLIRSNQGDAIEVEIWEMPLKHFGSFVANIPEPLGIGKVELENGSWVSGFICEDYAIEKAVDITSFGSWRNYMSSLNQ